MLLNNFEPPFGGPELQAIAIASRLMEREHQVMLVAKGTGNAPQSEQINGISVYRLNRKGCSSIEAWFQLLKLKDQFDIIHVHGVGRLASIAIYFARKHGKKVYVKVTTAGHIVKEVKPGVLGMLKNLSPFRGKKVALLKKADGMIGMSDELLAEMEKHGFLTEKIFYIPNGVDTGKFRLWRIMKK
jgi:glycosyltransferase involved in cell wall biosynthesis